MAKTEGKCEMFSEIGKYLPKIGSDVKN